MNLDRFKPEWDSGIREGHPESYPDDWEELRKEQHEDHLEVSIRTDRPTEYHDARGGEDTNMPSAE